MRTKLRETSDVVARMERRERRNKKLYIARQITASVVVILFLLPTRVNTATVWHGVISWSAIVAFFVVAFFIWRQKAPLTRWRNVRKKSAAAALAFLIIPPIVMFIRGYNPEQMDFYCLMWSGALLFAVLYVVGRVKYRRAKAEAEEEVERIRRREQRRKKLEIL